MQRGLQIHDYHTCRHHVAQADTYARDLGDRIDYSPFPIFDVPGIARYTNCILCSIF
jgi:hypothetical protein